MPYRDTKQAACALVVFAALAALAVAAPGRSAEARPDAAPVSVPAQSGAIVVDHTSTNVALVPDEWIAKARDLTLHYAHTSHGSQLMTGAQDLERLDPAYNVAVLASRTIGLPSETGALRIYDGNHGETYITPDLYWASADGIGRTRTVADTGLFNFSMWSWCGQQSSNSVAQVEAYLQQMDAFEAEYPSMRFIYMTGHTDGGSATLARNNQMVRDYVVAHDKVLFDFADIESYDPDGNHHPDTTDACAWCSEWCDAHPEECEGLPSSCAHSHPFNCRQKGRAFWWLMARLAGWGGPGIEPGPTPTLQPSPAPTLVPTAVPTDPPTASPSDEPERHPVYLPRLMHQPS